jgi:hypothetical protein
MSLYLLYLALILIGFLFSQIHLSQGANNISGNNTIDLEKVLAKYWGWWLNSPEAMPEKKPTCSIGIDTEDSFVFLLDSFDAEDASYDCTQTPIPKGYSIFFPLLASICSQGDNGLYGDPYEKIRDCTLNLDRGKVEGIVSINDKVIVNLTKDNGNGIGMRGILQNNLPQFDYYKQIVPTKFVDQLVTKNTTVPTNWAKPDEFKKGSVYYKSVVHCECVIIDTNQLGSGNFTLKYIVDAKAGKSSINLSDAGWQFISDTIYKLKIR